MEGEYYDNSRPAMREDLSLGEDGPVAGDGAPGVADRGLFGRHHHGGEYVSEVGGGGYGARPPMPYDGGYGDGDGYGAYEQRLPPPEPAYEGGYGGSSGYGGAPPAYEPDVAGGVDDRGLLHGRRHGHNVRHGGDLDEERRHKQYAEAAAAAAIGYGLYEHEKKKDAEKLERHGRPYGY